MTVPLTLSLTLAACRRAAAVLAALTALATPIGGCSQMSAQNDPKVSPLSDDESRAQVVDAAREIVRAAGLDITYANLQWEWCNDQGEPPFRTKVELAFVVPPGSTGQAAGTEIATAVAAQPGWEPGPPPGQHSAGDVVHKGNVWATVGPGNNPDRGAVVVFGECRNMNDHRDTGGVEITDEIRG